jgi:hypothetical protein
MVQSQLIKLCEAYLNLLQEYFANCFYSPDLVSYWNLHSVGAGATKSDFFFIMPEDFFYGWAEGSVSSSGFALPAGSSVVVDTVFWHVSR